MHPELENYRSQLEENRRMIIDLLEGLPAEALNWRPIEGTDDHATNSLAVLAAHVAGAEHHWIGEVIGGLPTTRIRAAEFETVAASADELRLLLEKVGAETEEVIARLSAETLEETRQARDRQVPVRWAFLHVVDHTALHLGHMQLTRQLWMERLPKQ